MTVCPKCNEREQHTFPNKKVIRYCADCAWELIEELINTPDEELAESELSNDEMDDTFDII